MSGVGESIEVPQTVVIPNDSELEPHRARELTRQIKVGLEHSYTLIIAAYRGQAWMSMGYSSWDAYCQGEFGNLALQPPREERQNVIMSMREAGMSVRAIKGATGLGQGTVQRAVQRDSLLHDAGVPNGTPETALGDAGRVTGVDGKSYRAGVVEPRPHRPARPAFEDVPLSDELLDLPAEDIGIEPLDVGARRRSGESRAAAARRLSGSMDAALPTMIRVAGQLMDRPSTGDSDDTETFSDLAADASRGILTLSHVLAGIDAVVLRGSAADVDAVSGAVTDAVDVLGRVLDDLHQR
ncbi:hypothetical protein [Arthrobacter pigmenti]